MASAVRRRDGGNTPIVYSCPAGDVRPARPGDVVARQFDRLGVQPGDRLYVTPRKVRVFVENL